jgi:hypothetical protein
MIFKINKFEMVEKGQNGEAFARVEDQLALAGKNRGKDQAEFSPDDELYDDEEVDCAEDEDYNEEEAYLNAEALMTQAHELIDRVGDPHKAFEMMGLDSQEKQLLIQRMQEQYYMQEQRKLLSQLSDEELYLLK